MWLSVDSLAEDFPGWTPYHYVHNNPINFVDPTGMSAVDSDDWFVQRETGAVVLSPGQSTLSQETADSIGDGDASKFDRLGPDNMFGENVTYAGKNLLDTENAVPIENPTSFMTREGYSKAENVTIFEREISSGGRIGDENFTNVNPDFKQIGNASITYAPNKNLNSKNILKENESKGDYSSIKTVTYNLTKPYGQDNRKTSYFYSNRSNDSGKKGSVSGSGLEVVLRAIFKNSKSRL
ncbi:hypothetical protein [Flavobacterium sp. JP2137]|uniref:hypothetical protein n=1 Tax=Flavobacterium sp. JP2137 TaxID=3414510 RepID=UPI003D2FD7A5